MIPPRLVRYGGGMTRLEFHAGEAAPGSGVDLKLNVFGVPSGMTVTVRQTETFPALCAGRSARHIVRPPVDDLSGSFSQVRDYCRLPAVVISSQDLERGNVQTTRDCW